jgi:hypothetical protein
MPGLPEDEPTALGVLPWVEIRHYRSPAAGCVRVRQPGPDRITNPGRSGREALRLGAAREGTLGGVLPGDRLFDQGEHPGRHEAGGTDN